MRTQPNSAVTLSVLDRLTDNDPRSPTVEAPLSRAESVRALKAGVRRDLEWLLNTRRNPDDPGALAVRNREFALQLRPPGFQRLQHRFSQGSTKLVRSLQAAVKTFEPRMANVRILPLEITSTGLRTLRIRIEGLLLMDPAPEHDLFRHHAAAHDRRLPH